MSSTPSTRDRATRWNHALLYLPAAAVTSELLGLSPWTLPGVVVTLLLLLTIAGSRRLRMGWRGNVVAYVMSSIVTAAIVFTDQSALFSKG